MTKRIGTFKFITDRKTLISTKRLMASLANNHVQNSVAFANRAAVCLRETIQYLKKLNDIEDRLLSQSLLDDEADEREDHAMVMESLHHLQAGMRILEALRMRKLEAGIAFEEAVDPIYRPAKVEKGKEPVPLEGVPMTMQLVEAVPEPAPGLSTGDLVVRFDEDLLEKARLELGEHSKNGF
jgi:hypothetical protein